MKTVSLSRGNGTLKEHKAWIEQIEEQLTDLQTQVNQLQTEDNEKVFDLKTEILSMSQDLARFKRDYTGNSSLNSTQITHLGVSLIGLLGGLSILLFGAYVNATNRISDLEKNNLMLLSKTQWQGQEIIKQRAQYPVNPP